MSLCLFVAAALYVWQDNDPRALENRLTALLHFAAFYMLIILAAVLVLLVARLFWKIEYLRRLQDEEDY